MSKFNLTTITRNISQVSGRTGLLLRKHSPEILVVAGVIGTVTSAIMACKATTKVSAIMDDAKETINSVHTCASDPKLKEQYQEEDRKKDLTIVYVQTGVKLVKLYAPSVILGVISMGSMVASSHILKKRNMALAAAYATVDKGFKEYRGRVAERFGEDMDRELKYDIKAKEIEEAEIDKNGKEKSVKKTVNVVNPNEYSDYARFFDDGCTGWEKNPEYNLMFLKAQQNYANDMLVSRGHLFLNEVYDMLGIPRSKEGQVVGWIYNEKNPIGDNFVDFGIFDAYRAVNRDFVNGYEPTILLDFNVDGNVWELM